MCKSNAYRNPIEVTACYTSTSALTNHSKYGDSSTRDLRCGLEALGESCPARNSGIAAGLLGRAGYVFECSCHSMTFSHSTSPSFSLKSPKL